jgi:hypothetical protein
VHEHDQESVEQEQSPAATAAAPASLASAAPGLASGPTGAALFLQRHAGNRAVARMVTARALARDPTDDLVKDPALQDLLPDPGRTDLGGAGDVEQLDDKSQDRYDKIAGSGGVDILKQINPNALNFTKYPCTQNCPKAAADVQNYLNTGSFPSSTCSPLNEPKNGYSIDPGPDSWNKSADWKTAFAAIKKLIPSHGSCVIVEGDRGPSGHEGLTQWHYFVVANVRGKYVIIDGFIGQVSTDVDGYITGLGTKTYSYTTQTPTVKPVR